jgi:DNA uptake protein ComE-like DNA-binding protein
VPLGHPIVQITQKENRMFRKISVAALLCATLAGISLAAQEAPTAPTATLVDINSAPVSEIEEVVRDEQLAERIVEGRPYANKRQLLTRDLVTSEEYERIKDRIVARRIRSAP